MHPLVRDLYKRIIFAGRDYPLGVGYIRDKAKARFRENKDLDVNNELELKKVIAEGRYFVKEIIVVSQLKKFRDVKRNYDL